MVRDLETGIVILNCESFTKLFMIEAHEDACNYVQCKPSFKKYMYTSVKFMYYANYPSRSWAEASRTYRCNYPS